MNEEFELEGIEIVAMVFNANPEELAQKAKEAELRVDLSHSDPYYNVYIIGGISAVDEFLTDNGYDFNDVSWI